jgi:hypothetical protein
MTITLDTPDGVQPNYEPFEEAAKAAPFYCVAIYLADRAYGGPEEGGWWFSCGQLVKEAPDGVNPNDLLTVFMGEGAEEEARAFADTLQDSLNAHVNNPRGYRANLSSVCCEGRYVAEVCEGFPTPFYPAERPHYE